MLQPFLIEIDSESSKDIIKSGSESRFDGE